MDLGGVEEEQQGGIIKVKFLPMREPVEYRKDSMLKDDNEQRKQHVPFLLLLNNCKEFKEAFFKEALCDTLQNICVPCGVNNFR